MNGSGAFGRIGYLVVGPESSGTKVTARLLRAAGCRSVAILGGDDGPQLPLDGRPPLLRRSMPHASNWWTIAELLDLLDVDDVRAVVTTRDRFAMAESQVARAHVPNVAAAHENIRRAYGEMCAGLREASLPFVLSSYEALVSRRDYAPRLLELLGLPPTHVETYDGNEKWYDGRDQEARVAAYPARKRA